MCSPDKVGHEVAHYLRDKMGSGDDRPRDDSVEEFFGRLGAKLAVEKHGGSPPPDPSNFLKKMELLCPTNTTGEEAREYLLEKAPKPPRDEYHTMWKTVTYVAGSRAAEENYSRALTDEDLIYKTPREIKDEFGLVERECEAVREIIVFE